MRLRFRLHKGLYFANRGERQYYNVTSPFGAIRDKVEYRNSNRGIVMTLTQQIAAKAEATVANVKQTDYQHHSHINDADGIYDCD
jgi:hypothetical protein